MTRRYGLQAAWLAGLFGLLQSCADPIVGAECRDGFDLCTGKCVQLDSDFRNCGGCGNDCGFFICDEGMCSGTELRPDAGLPDGGVPLRDAGPLGDAALDASSDIPDARVSPDSGVSGCGLGEIECGGSCVDPGTNPEHCGTCDQACIVGEFCVVGSCSPACDPPLVACGSLCIDVLSNPFHCGSCGHVCESGICVGGECADAVPGHLVVIGHDYERSTEVMRRIATNAVFLASASPVRVLSYVGGATTTSVANIRAALDDNDEGRTWQEIEGLEPIITRQLAQAEVFLVYPQQSSANSVLDKLGDQWGNALGQFMLAGGVVVLFETYGGSNDGTYRILQPPKLFVASARARVPRQILTVTDPGVGLAYNLTASYQNSTRTSSFEAITSPGTVVVQDDLGDPVVFHRVVR
jgi:hypothetical protein